jgi:hypothetical protein
VKAYTAIRKRCEGVEWINKFCECVDKPSKWQKRIPWCYIQFSQYIFINTSTWWWPCKAETCSISELWLAIILLSLSWYRCCPETSVKNYKLIPHNIPKEGKSQPHERGFTAWSKSLASILSKLCRWISLFLIVVMAEKNDKVSSVLYNIETFMKHRFLTERYTVWNPRTTNTSV